MRKRLKLSLVEDGQHLLARGQVQADVELCAIPRTSFTRLMNVLYLYLPSQLLSALLLPTGLHLASLVNCS